MRRETLIGHGCRATPVAGRRPLARVVRKGATAALLAPALLSCSVVVAEHDPQRAFERMVGECGERGAEAVERRLSAGSRELLEEYDQLARALDATNLPANPTEVLADQLHRDAPVFQRLETVSSDTCEVHFTYAAGGEGAVLFVRERRKWRFDLAREMRSAMEQMRAAAEMLESYRSARDAGRPAVRLDG